MFNDNFREVEMGAIFHITTANAETGEIEDSCSTKNTILIGAYRYMAGAQAKPVDAGVIVIGEDGTEPNENQSGIASPLASKDGTFSRDLVNPLKWYYEVYFSSEEANGTNGTSEIREVAAKWGSGPYLNRALFRDVDGITPRTITKTSSQVLTVKMEFEIRRSGTI